MNTRDSAVSMRQSGGDKGRFLEEESLCRVLRDEGHEWAGERRGASGARRGWAGVTSRKAIVEARGGDEEGGWSPGASSPGPGERPWWPVLGWCPRGWTQWMAGRNRGAAAGPRDGWLWGYGREEAVSVRPRGDSGETQPLRPYRTLAAPRRRVSSCFNNPRAGVFTLMPSQVRGPPSWSPPTQGESLSVRIPQQRGFPWHRTSRSSRRPCPRSRLQAVSVRPPQ